MEIQKDTREKVIVVYRDNPAFKEVTELVQSTLPAGQVGIHVFPTGTQEKDIAQWAADNKPALDRNYSTILTDETFRRAVHQQNSNLSGKFDGGDRRTTCKYSRNTLDSFVDKATFEALAGKVSQKHGDQVNMKIESCVDYELPQEQKAEALPVVGDIFKEMLSYVPQDKRPQRIFIVSNHMTDHAPFEAFEYGKGYEAAETLATWFREAGFSTPEAVGEERSSGTEADDYLEEKRVTGADWVVVDRHAFSDGFGRSVRVTKVIPLPLTDALKTLVYEGFIDSKRIRGSQEFRESYLSALRSLIAEEMYDFLDPETRKVNFPAE